MKPDNKTAAQKQRLKMQKIFQSLSDRLQEIVPL